MLHRHPRQLHTDRTFGQRAADRVSRGMGSWRFIITQGCVLVVWMLANVYAWSAHWDPYPFILLNLVLSTQAAFAAPVIMMSQNRQAEVDRDHAENAYHHVDELLEINKRQLVIIQDLERRVPAVRPGRAGSGL